MSLNTEAGLTHIQHVYAVSKPFFRLDTVSLSTIFRKCMGVKDYVSILNSLSKNDEKSFFNFFSP